MQKEDSYNDMIVDHAYQNGQMSDEEYNKYQAGSHVQKTGIAAGQAANIVSDWRQQSQKAQLDQTETQTALGKAKLNQTGPFAPNPYAQTPIWADDGSGNQVQVGIYGDDGKPTYFPYGRAGGPRNEPFRPPDETTKIMKDAGFVFAATSDRSGRWINTKGNADLDENGNPIYSTDGTMVQSGGKMKPITTAMATAKMLHDAANQPTPTPAPSNLNPLNWFRGNGGQPSPTPTPAAPSAGGGVRVISPQGIPGSIPPDRLPDYLAAGYTRG